MSINTLSVTETFSLTVRETLLLRATCLNRLELPRRGTWSLSLRLDES
jgi:hypothetical protein